jgi:peroxiredoxin
VTYLRQILPLCALALALLWAGSVLAALPLSSPMPAFALKNVDGQTVSSGSLSDSKILVVVFTGNHCMYSRAYQKRLIELQRTYGPKGAQIVLINPSAAGEPEEVLDSMKTRAAEQKYPFPYLADPTQETAKAFGAARLPEVFLFAADRKLVYKGRIDDNTEERMVRTTDLRSALDYLLAGTPDKIPHTGSEAFGCSIKWTP